MKYLVILACIALATASSAKSKKDEQKDEHKEVPTEPPPRIWYNPFFYSGPEGKFVQKPFFQSWLPPFYAYPQGAYYSPAQAAFYPPQPQFNPYFQNQGEVNQEVQYQGHFIPYAQYQSPYGNPTFAQQSYQGVEGQQPVHNPLFYKYLFGSRPFIQQQESV